MYSDGRMPKQILAWTGRPGQAHVDRVLGQGDQRAQLPDLGGITLLGWAVPAVSASELAANSSAKLTVDFRLIAPSMVD